MAEAPSLEGSICESLDGFTQLGVEKCMTASSSSLISKSQYGQVVFHDLCEVYPTDCDINCRYSLTNDVQPQPGDKVALFKVGWMYVSEYLTFERVQQATRTNSGDFVTFKAENLPKNYQDLFQFCYMTSGNVIAGASIPFGFRRPTTVETELVAVEDPGDPDLVVFVSNVALQENLKKVSEEKDSLSSKYEELELSLIRMKELLAKSILDKEVLAEEIQIMAKERENIESEKLVLKNKLTDSAIEKTVSTLKDNLESMDKERNKLQELIQEKENEIKGHEARIECLIKDRDYFEKNLRDNVSRNECLKAEKKDLDDRLNKMAEKINKMVLEKLEHEGEAETFKKTIEELRARIQTLETTISQGSVIQQSRSLLDCEEEKVVLEVRLMTLEEAHSKCSATIAELREAENRHANQLKTEMSKAAEEAQNLIENIFDSYKDEKKKQQTSTSKDPEVGGVLDSISDTVKFAWDSFQGISKCQNCQRIAKTAVEDKERLISRVNLILEEKSTVSSELVQTRHEKNQLLKFYSEMEDENSALKSRVKVLEYELSNIAKNRTNPICTSCGGAESAECDPLDGTLDGMKVEFETFKDSVAVIKKFNAIMSDKSILEESLEQEKKQKLSLQKKVEDLLLQDSLMCKQVDEMRKRLEGKKVEREISSSPRHIFHGNEKMMETNKDEVEQMKEVEKLHKKACCSATHEQLQDVSKKNDALLKCYQKDDQVKLNQQLPDKCPLCHRIFISYDSFVSHFEDHMT